MMTNDNQLLYVTEVAELLRVSARTCYRWMDDGVIRYVRLGGRRRVRRDVIDGLMAGHPIAERF